MEEVEEANRAAVESCHRVISIISKPLDQNQYRNLKVETGQAVVKFKRVVSLLSTGSGHGRVRKMKNFQFPSGLPQKLFLDNPNTSTDSSARTLQLLLRHDLEKPGVDLNSTDKNIMQLTQKDFLQNSVLDMGSVTRGSIHLSQQQQQQQKLSLTPYQLFQQQQLQQQRFQLQQQQHMKFQAEMMQLRNNSSLSSKFDSPSCTPTMSSTRSFISSLSVDGSVANMSGNSFQLLGAPQSSNSQQTHKQRCSGRGADGSVKCGSSGRCHCSKRRKLRVKRSIKVPAISNKIADIPPDEYSWRKYGQKPIKGSPHPRFYNGIHFPVMTKENISTYDILKGHSSWNLFYIPPQNKVVMLMVMLTVVKVGTVTQVARSASRDKKAKREELERHQTNLLHTIVDVISNSCTINVFIIFGAKYW